MRSARVDLVGSRLHFVDFSSGLAVPSEKCAKNRKSFKFLQISSKLHRLNRWKDGIFSSMRSARVDWGKSHRQAIKFSRGLRFRAKICIFSTRKHKKISFFRIFSIFSRHGSSWCSTELSNTCKIRILKKSVQLRIQLRGSAAESIPARENPCLKMSKYATKKCHDV